MPGSRRGRVTRDDAKRREVLRLLRGRGGWDSAAAAALTCLSDALANVAAASRRTNDLAMHAAGIPPSRFHLRKSELRFILHE